MAEELRTLFNQYFDIRCDVDSSPALLAETLRLRYQVYCVEHAYEDPDAFPNGMEEDGYDTRSLHALLIHRASTLAAGTVRLIRPDVSFPIGSLPIETLCKEPDLFDESILPRASLAEVSRFAVSKAFRRRAEDAPTPSGVGLDWRERQEIEQRRLPHLSLGLVQAMVCLSAHHGITHWVAEMEPALLRMYSKLGVHWIKLGPVVEFHGKRQPCYTHLDQMLDRNLDERPDIWDLITDGGDCIRAGKTRAFSQEMRGKDIGGAGKRQTSTGVKGVGTAKQSSLPAQSGSSSRSSRLLGGLPSREGLKDRKHGRPTRANLGLMPLLLIAKKCKQILQPARWRKLG